MSIVVCIKTGEGLVLAADSVVAIEVVGPAGPQVILNTYEYARKLSHIGNLPIGALTWGNGLIGKRNIESLLSEFENAVLPELIKEPYKLEDIVSTIFNFMKERYEKAYGSVQPGQGPVIGMLIAGYSSGGFFPEEYRLILPTHNAPERIRPDEGGNPVYGASWHGQIDAIQRLYKGYDHLLGRILIEKGVDKKIIEELQKDLVKLEWPIIYDGMPLQDAIDLAEYLIRVVIGRFRFLPGPPICGGDIDIAVITYKEFTWVRRKKWQ